MSNIPMPDMTARALQRGIPQLTKRARRVEPVPEVYAPYQDEFTIRPRGGPGIEPLNAERRRNLGM